MSLHTWVSGDEPKREVVRCRGWAEAGTRSASATSLFVSCSALLISPLPLRARERRKAKLGAAGWGGTTGTRAGCGACRQSRLRSGESSARPSVTASGAELESELVSSVEPAWGSDFPGCSLELELVRVAASAWGLVMVWEGGEPMMKLLATAISESPAPGGRIIPPQAGRSWEQCLMT